MTQKRTKSGGSVLDLVPRILNSLIFSLSCSPEQNRRELQDVATNATERLCYNYTIIYKGKERRQKATKVGA